MKKLTLVLLEVSTSDESCFSVCVKLRDASASARVSSTGGRLSHVSHPPTHPATLHPAVGVAAELAEEEDEEEEDFSVLGAAIEAAAALAAAANKDGEAALDTGGVATASG